MKFEGATVLITGANRGLGRALVGASLEAGARRVYAAARDPREAARVAADDRIVPIALDVTDADSLVAAAGVARDVTLLINNAGVLASQGVLESSRSDLERDFAVNFYGIRDTTRAFLPALERAATAALVNVLSVVSLASMPAIGGYSAAKAAAHSLSQALRSELLPRGIGVHSVFPGPIDTDMIKSFIVAKTPPEAVARAIVQGVEAGAEEILPDPTSREMWELWRRDPKALGERLASM